MRNITITIVDCDGAEFTIEREAGITLREVLQDEEVLAWFDACGDDICDDLVAIGDGPDDMADINSDFMRKRELRAACEDGMFYGINRESTDCDCEGCDGCDGCDGSPEAAGIRFTAEADNAPDTTPNATGSVNVSISAGLRVLCIQIELGKTSVMDILRLPNMAAAMGINTGSVDRDMEEVLKYNVTYSKAGAQEVSQLYNGNNGTGLLLVTKPEDQSTIYLDIRTASSGGNN